MNGLFLPRKSTFWCTKSFISGIFKEGPSQKHIWSKQFFVDEIMRNICLRSSASHLDLRKGMPSPPRTVGWHTVSMGNKFRNWKPRHKNLAIAVSNLEAQEDGSGRTWARYQTRERAKVFTTSALSERESKTLFSQEKRVVVNLDSWCSQFNFIIVW